MIVNVTRLITSRVGIRIRMRCKVYFSIFPRVPYLNQKLGGW